MGRADQGSIASLGQVPEELSAVALRLGWSAGDQGKTQVRVVIGNAAATVLRRVVLELLTADGCLREGRRTALAILDDDLARSGG